MFGWLTKIAAVLTSIVAIWKYLIKRRQQLWARFLLWRKRRRENEVDKAINGSNINRIASILRKIRKKRDKRRNSS